MTEAPKTCRVTDCGGPIYSKGFCQSCYHRDYRKRKRLELNAKRRVYAKRNRKARSAATRKWRHKRAANPESAAKCSVDGCERIRESRGYCNLHYLRWSQHGEPGPAGTLVQPREGTCARDGCDRPIESRGWCMLHYDRVRHTGEPGPLKRTRTGEPWIDARDYRVIWRDGKIIKEHRWIMREALGRELVPGETVHHRNGVRTDNRLENLELRSGYHPQGAAIADHVAWAREILDRYDQPQLRFLLD